MWNALRKALGVLPEAAPTSSSTNNITSLKASSQGVVLGGSNAGFINTGEFNGTVVIVQGQSYSCNLHIPFSTDLTGAPPAKLLRWSSRLPKELVGRSEELAKLHDWANGPAVLSCAVIEGGAGVGKTRLAFELADALRLQGWQAGQLSDPSAPVAFAASEQGALLILDYPDEQPSAVEKFFEGLKRSGESIQASLPKLRVLLLCRSYASLQPHHSFLNLEAAQDLLPMQLQALVAQEPWELFQQATQAFAAFQTNGIAGAHLSEQDFQLWLNKDSAHRSALMVQALALSQIYAPGSAQAGDALIASLLIREREHFLKRCQALGWAVDIQQGAWAMQVLAAVAGEFRFDELQALHQAFHAAGPAPSAALGGRALPSQAQWRTLLGDAASGIRAIEPDLLAAHALHNPALMPDADLLAHVFVAPLLSWQQADAAAYGKLLEDRLNRLARLNWDRPTNQLGQPDVWIKAAELLVKAAAEFSVWHRILHRQPLPPALIPLATAMDEQLVRNSDGALSDSSSPEAQNQLAGNLSNLSISLAAAGQREQGIVAILRAVEIYEKLAQGNFAAYASDLARSLSNLSNHLGESGQREQGLAAILRAVEIREKLAKDNFAAYAPDLAMSLGNLSVRLAEAGQREQGLAAILRAVVIHEKLAKDNFAAYAPALASSLNNLSILLAEAGQREQGMAAILRALEIYEKLAKDNFAAYAPALAGSLNNLSIALAEAGQREQGVAAIRRAVAIREKLAKDNFAAYAPDLAMSLGNLSNRLAEAGQHEQGMAAMERACELIAPFAQPNTTYAGWQTMMLRQRDELRALQSATKPS